MTKVEKLIKDEKLVGYKVVTEGKDGTFIIPVVDARASGDSRRKANYMLKQNNIARGSKYFKPSYSVLGYSYNISMKK